MFLKTSPINLHNPITTLLTFKHNPKQTTILTLNHNRLDTHLLPNDFQQVQTVPNNQFNSHYTINTPQPYVFLNKPYLSRQSKHNNILIHKQLLRQNQTKTNQIKANKTNIRNTLIATMPH